MTQFRKEESANTKVYDFLLRLGSEVANAMLSAKSSSEGDAQWRSTVTIDSHSLSRWTVLRKDGENFGIEITGHDSVNRPLFDANGYNGSLPAAVTLIVKKGDRCGTFFFSASGFHDWLAELTDWPADLYAVRVCENFEPFSSRGAQFLPLSAEQAATNAAPSDWADPRSIVHDYGRDQTTPASVQLWTLPVAPKQSTVADAFADVSCRRMLATLASRVWINDSGSLVLSLSGVRRIEKSLQLDPFQAADAVMLSGMVEWVFAHKRDARVRHTFMEGALSRNWDVYEDRNPDADFLRACQSEAETTYQAYLTDSAEKTVKLLGELRKTLADDSAKLSQQARDVMSTAWKDAIIAFSALSARVLLVLSNSEARSSLEVEVGLYAAAVLILLSGISSIALTSLHIHAASVSLANWRDELYRFVSEPQWKRLADVPMKRAKSAFNYSTSAAIIVYAMAICALAMQAKAVRHERTVERARVLQTSPGDHI